MNINDIIDTYRDDIDGAIDTLLTEGISKIQSFRSIESEPYFEKAYVLSMDQIKKETDKSLINQYEMKFADVFSKYTFSLFIQNTKNPLKFMEVVTKFKKQNDENNKGLSKKVMEVVLDDCDTFYSRYCSDLNSCFYMTWSPFNFIMQKVENNNSSLSLQTLIKYLKIAQRCITSVKSSTITEVSCSIMNSFINHYEKEIKNSKKKLRTIDETNFKNFISILQKLLKGANLKQLEKFESDVLLDFLMSDFLGKQFYALSRFNSFSSFSKDLIDQFRQRDVINKLLFKSNLHHELIQQFYIFLSKLFEYSFYDDSIIEQLWTKTFEKSEELEDYFNAWPILQGSIPAKNQKFFWNLVLTKTPSFSSVFIRTFLIKIAPNCNEKDRIEMINLLWKSAIESTNESEEFVDVISEYIPNDNEFRDELKKRCFSLFIAKDEESNSESSTSANSENEDKTIFALKLLIKIWKCVDENKTQEDFDFLLKNGKLTINNALTFLNLLSTIANNFVNPLTDEELDLIKKQIVDIISVNSIFVFNFIQGLLNARKGRLFTPHLLFSLLEWMTKLPTVDSVTFKLIRILFEMIHSSSKKNEITDDTTDYLKQAIESLWDLLYRTDIPDVADFLVKIYMKKCLNNYIKKNSPKSNKKKRKKKNKSAKSKEKNNSESNSNDNNNDNNNNADENTIDIDKSYVNDFINKCFQKLDSFGSLTALYFLISEIEDSLNLEKNYEIHRNVFNGYKQNLTIHLTKDYMGDVSIPEGTSYYSFRKIVRELIKANDSQITLMSGQNKLDRNHVFKHNEKIKVFFYTFNQDEENNKNNTTTATATSNNAQQKKNDENNEDQESESESSSSSSTFSFDINSFNIEWKKEDLPSQILVKYRDQIKSLLDNNNNNLICEAALNLLNYLSIDENEVNLLKTKSDLFDINHPFLFIYRLNLLANLVDNKDFDVLTNLFNSDLYTELINIVFKMDRKTFTKDEYYDLLLETVVDINKIGCETKELKKLKRNCMKSFKQDSDSSLASIMNWIIEEEKLKPVNTVRVIDFLVILNDFIQIDKKLFLDHQRFPEFFDLTLFNDNQSIRSTFFKVLTYIKTSRIQEFALSRLNFSRKANCNEYFLLIKRIAKFSPSHENSKFLFDTLVDSLNENLFIYKDIKVRTDDKSLINAARDLCADLANQDFIKGIIDNLEFIFPLVYESADDDNDDDNSSGNEEEDKKEKRVAAAATNAGNSNDDDDDEIIKKPELLIHILVDKIIFNTNRYVYSPTSLLNLVKLILNRFPSLFSPLVESLTKFSESIGNVKNSYLGLYSTDKKDEKGLANLGCTCYLNASVQQLFHIKEIRNAILSYDPGIEATANDSEEGKDGDDYISKNWLCQLQLLMANLEYAPLSSIDASGFVSHWKMYGNDSIDPNEQQDAVEFLQILLDRLDESIPGKPISKCVRGQIIHTIKQINGNFQSQSYEDFITFTLEVINKKNFNESFDAFLEPDIFDGDNKYNVEEIGQIDAARYHAINKAPEILIFQLKRFDFDLSSLTRKKINSEYQIDLDVDISRLLYNSNNNNNNQPCIYELFGIIEHSGGAEGGHYTSFIKSSEVQTDKENESSSSWKIYNDSRVSNVDEKEVLKSATGGDTTRRFYDPVTQTVKTSKSTKIESAYILFYRKKENQEEETKKKEKISTEIEEEEEENSSRSITNNQSEDDQDYPIQFMPEVMLRRFFKNMKSLILRHVLFSNEYIKFMDYISKVDNTSTFTFIYQYTMKSISSVTTNIKSSSIIQTAKKKASTDVNFARYILKKKDNLLIDMLLNFTENKQATVSCQLANAAISVVNNANKEKHLYDEDAEFINMIIEKKEELIQHTDKFDFIFMPFFYYLEIEDISFDLSKKYLDFFLDLLESIGKKEKEEAAKNQRNKLSKYKSTFISSKTADSSENNIAIDEAQQKKINVSYVKESNQTPLHTRIDFQNINMTHVFKSILILIEKNDFEKDDKEYYHSIKNKVINKEFMYLWSQSRHHHFNFNSLVVHFLKDDRKMTDRYFNFLCSANEVPVENDDENDRDNDDDKDENESKSKGNSKNSSQSKKQKQPKKSAKNHHHHHNHDFVPHGELKETMRKSSQKMTIQKLSAIFANLLTFRDSLTSYRIQWFFEFTEKLKWSQFECASFFRESSVNIKENCKEMNQSPSFDSNLSQKEVDIDQLIIDPYPLFDSDSHRLLTKYLLNDDQLVRGSFVSLVYSVFPSFPKVQIHNGNVYADTTKKLNETNSNNGGNNNVGCVKFVRESDSKVGVNVNESESDLSESDATEHSVANNESKSDKSDNDNDQQKDIEVDHVSAQEICELQALIKLFNILMKMNKEVANKSKEIAAEVESYQGAKLIPTDTFFELLSWSTFHLIGYSDIIVEEPKKCNLQSELKSKEIEFLTKFDLSSYSSTFSDLIIKFSSFKNSIRCSVIDLLRFIYIVYFKTNLSKKDDQNEFKYKKNSNKKHVIIGQSNSLIYLNAISHFPTSFEMSSFIEYATVYFIPIITPFADKIESHILKSKFVEMTLKLSINSKSNTTTFIKDVSQANNNSAVEVSYYSSSGVSSVQRSTGNIATVISDFLKKLKVSEKICNFLWKKRKSSVWGKSPLLLQISSDMIERGGWNAVDFFTEFGCIDSIITEFETQHEAQQLNFFTWELMLKVVHAYNRCYILKQSGKETIIASNGNIKNSDVEKNEQSPQKVEKMKDDNDDDSDVKSSEGNKDAKNSKKPHGLMKKFSKNFVDLWKENSKFLSIINGYLVRGIQNYNVIAFKVLKDVFLDGATFSTELTQIGLKIVMKEPDNFYLSIKQQEIREKYARMSIQIINASNKIKVKKSDTENDKKSKKSKNVKSSTSNLNNSAATTAASKTSNFCQKEASRLIQSKLFNVPLFELFVSEVENDEVKTKLFIEFLSNFNDFSQINEKFASDAVDLLSRNGHKLEKIKKIEENIVMTKKEKKKFDDQRKVKDIDVEHIISNVNNLIEKDLLKILRGIDSKIAAEIIERLLFGEKLMTLMNDKLNADAKYTPNKKDNVEKIMGVLEDKRKNKEVYEQLFQVVERILTPNKK